MYPYCVAVCEDDELVREEIRSFCGRVLSEERIEHEISVFSGTKELEDRLRENSGRYHLLILDIMMDGKTGMELAEELRAQSDDISFIFVTGYEEYLAEGYEVQPVHFLLKPIVWEKLRKALLTDWRQKHSRQTVVLRKGRQNLRLSVHSILYAETDGRHGTRLILSEGEDRFPAGISELEQMLPAGQFIRCHNSYLVNMDHVRRIDRQDFCMDDGRRLPISRKYLAPCREAVVRVMNRRNL